MSDTEDKGLGSTASKGVGSFFFAMIPWALATGAIAWLGFYMAFHEDHKELSQEQRMATYVGAAERPKSKITIEDATRDCVALTRAEFDEPTLLMYAENRCSHPINYLAWHWKLVSPDGTALKEGYTNGGSCPVPAHLHEKAECKTEVRGYSWETAEDRAVKIVIWLKTDTD